MTMTEHVCVVSYDFAVVSEFSTVMYS